jgi:hypothetical protein
MKTSEPPYIVIDMPLNEKGEGPEMDQSKVRCVMYQVWDSNNVVVREYFSPRKAEAVCRKMNEYNNGKT